LVTKW